MVNSLIWLWKSCISCRYFSGLNFSTKLVNAFGNFDFETNFLTCSWQALLRHQFIYLQYYFYVLMHKLDLCEYGVFLTSFPQRGHCALLKLTSVSVTFSLQFSTLFSESTTLFCKGESDINLGWRSHSWLICV